MASSLLLLQGQLNGIVLHDTRTWTIGFTFVYIGVIMLGLEILSVGVPALFGLGGVALIPVKGKHLDVLEPLDRTFIFVNKLLTCLFVTNLMQVVVAAPSLCWRPEEATLLNTIGSLCMFYAVYDLFYMTFHRILHIPSLYVYIHKVTPVSLNKSSRRLTNNYNVYEYSITTDKRPPPAATSTQSTCTLSSSLWASTCICCPSTLCHATSMQLYSSYWPGAYLHRLTIPGSISLCPLAYSP